MLKLLDRECCSATLCKAAEVICTGEKFRLCVHDLNLDSPSLGNVFFDPSSQC